MIIASKYCVGGDMCLSLTLAVSRPQSRSERTAAQQHSQIEDNEVVFPEDEEEDEPVVVRHRAGTQHLRRLHTSSD